MPCITDGVTNGLCGICPAGCFVTVTLENGRLVRVEPREGHPLGMICRIGSRAPEIVHDPDRVLYPQRRKGPKGNYEFETISWDDAYQLIVERFNRIKSESGPEAVAIYTGRGSFDMALCDIFQPADVAVSSASSVLFPFGSPNTLGVGALCYVSFAMIAPHLTMGEMLVTMETDLEQAELIVLWGANPATDSPPLAHQQVLRARERGARIIAIDPRRNETAREAEAEWIPIRPGTDGALALGMINVLIEEESYDEEFARNWTVGFDELAQMVQHYRPEVVAGITGVPEETVRSLARSLATSRGASPVMYSGLEYSDSGVQAIRAVFTLWALAGQLDVPGGLLFRMKENIFPQNRSRLIPNPDLKKALGRDRFPVYSAYRGESHAIALPDAVLSGSPYPIRALAVLGGSIITAWPRPEIWKKTLGSLDFLVTINRYHTADSAYADLVLPATTYFENVSYMRYGPLFKIRERLVEPQGEARNDFLILAELARRLGYGNRYPQSEEDLLRFALEGTGFDLEEVRANDGEARLKPVLMQYKKWEKGLLRPDGAAGFNTPSGRFEIASSILAENGYDPLPVYTEPAEGPLAAPELARDYPLVFNSGTRTYYDFRTQHHGVPGLAQHLAEPPVTLNDQDAWELGISDGDRVLVESPRGAARFTARVTPDIVRGAIDAAMGGGGPLGSAPWRECNVNELTDLGRFDPISGFPVYKTLLCRVRKEERGARDRSAPSIRGTREKPVALHRAEPREPGRKVYLDNNATTEVSSEVREAMLPFLSAECGNPSSIHSSGSRARAAVEGARRVLAQALNCTARRIVFTGGGSEANNLAIFGVLHGCDEGRHHIIASAVEHPAVLAPCRALQREGYLFTLLPVRPDGTVDPQALKEALRPDTLLVSVMLANNETGAIQPVRELAEITHESGALFHCDAVQALGKIPVDVEDLGVDLLSVSAHKLHGPKGLGALYIRKDVPVAPLIWGGGQERGLRAGTENVPGIVGFGRAVELAVQRLNAGEEQRLAELRDRLEEGVARLLPGATRNGPREARLANTLNLTLPEIRGESLVLFLDRKGIACSSGSACKSGHPDPSPALLAMGLTPHQAHCSIRFSLGAQTGADDIAYLLQSLQEILSETRSAVRFVACR
ncbi:IscS subfamily cysteine desulfurase [Geomesophilobacter sediminis]|uniref:cysteine desulfurase n=1 Tax=Geomesophilobacter sediminis TaxID=2798584 RepID=A0A8J7J5M8_9BACT|nr:IscS subfamily cysteine desulfurase [Geomesophilobacter sediminis]MBJ6726298.1 IscS subfamily cysteine desulfurase [Geomesophilobacter sediminis]